MKLKNLPFLLHRNSKKINKISYQGRSLKITNINGFTKISLWFIYN